VFQYTKNVVQYMLVFGHITQSRKRSDESDSVMSREKRKTYFSVNSWRDTASVYIIRHEVGSQNEVITYRPLIYRQ